MLAHLLYFEHYTKITAPCCLDFLFVFHFREEIFFANIDKIFDWLNEAVIMTIYLSTHVFYNCSFCIKWFFYTARWMKKLQKNGVHSLEEKSGDAKNNPKKSRPIGPGPASGQLVFNLQPTNQPKKSRKTEERFYY